MPFMKLASFTQPLLTMLFLHKRFLSNINTHSQTDGEQLGVSVLPQNYLTCRLENPGIRRSPALPGKITASLPGLPPEPQPPSTLTLTSFFFCFIMVSLIAGKNLKITKPVGISYLWDGKICIISAISTCNE